MTVTLIGVVLTADGLSQGREVADDGWTMRTRSWAAAGPEARSTQANRIPVNISHDDNLVLGEVVSLHRTAQNTVWALAVCDADRLLEHESPLYFSPKSWRNPDGTDITIEHVALTDSPATVSIPAIEVYPGGIESAGGWMFRRKRFNGFRRELVEQAVERRRNRDAPLRVGGHDPDIDPWQLREGQHGAFELPGGLRKSGARGKVLRVS